jgi:uncharacterized iron-regulated membrane protein
MEIENSLKIANIALLAITGLGVVLSVTIYLLSQLNEKAKDRQMAAYKVQAQQEISRANQAAEDQVEGG